MVQMDVTDGEEQQRAPGTGTAGYLWWTGGATSSFNSCPVYGWMHTVSVYLGLRLLAPFLSSHSLGISCVPGIACLSLCLPELGFLVLLFVVLRPAECNRCTWGILLTRLGRHRPVLCLHLIGQMHSLCFSLLARCP